MTYTLPSTMEMGRVVLNVNDLEKMTNYYRDVVGLQVLNQNERASELGVKDGAVLVELLKTDHARHPELTNGLYHFALLLPERRDLGNLLRRLAEDQVEVGAGDHDYSEALYLTDPEGNGIEIYADRPSEMWTVTEEGDIVGVTRPIDAVGILSSADDHRVDLLPEGTIMGHQHLVVSDLEASFDFYKDILGLEKKYFFGRQAVFMAAGFYHHHIAFNTWNHTDRLVEDGRPGLNHFEIFLEKEDLSVFSDHLEAQAWPYELVDGGISLKDPTQIEIHVLSK